MLSQVRDLLPRISLRIRLGYVRLVAALFAAVFFYVGFTHFEPVRRTEANFDETAVWLGLALLSLAVLAWDGARPHPTTWPVRLAAFVGRHWWELALLLPIVGFAVFMFTFRFGEFPPSDLICCEERFKGEGAYEVLQQGLRPLEYGLGKYSVAVGFLLFGENTLGLRLPSLLAGILMVPVFYLLLRQLVGPPAALFATALLASSWPLTITGDTPQVSYLATVLFVYLVILGIRTRNALALLGAGFLAGVLSYEYATHKALPVLVGGFLTALVAYRLAFPLPNGVRAFLARLSSLVTTNWRSAVAFVGAALIAATPLLVTIDQGNDRYFSGLDRGIDDRGGTFLASNWEEQLRWVTEMFSPLGGDFPRKFISGGPLVDPITGTLLVVGVILGVVTFWRPFRLLFLAWYLGVLGAGALLLFGFGAFKFVGVLPAGLALVAFLVDDAGWVARRWARGSAVLLLPLFLLGSVVYVAYWNADTLLGTVTRDPRMLKEYEQSEGMQYALCDYLRGRVDENFSYTFNAFAPTRGFAQPHETSAEQNIAWGDFRWVCHDLRGRALASPAEAWPMRDIPAGPLTWAFVIDSRSTEEVVASVGPALPDRMEPDRIITGSQDVRSIVAYELSGRELKARQGLWGEYRSGEGTLLEERVDDPRRISWDAQSRFTPPFTVRWRGLIYVAQAGRAALTARSSDPTVITVDGRISYSSLDETVASFPRDLLPGWHPVEVLLRKETPGGSFALEWVGPEVQASAVAREDLYALASLEGWLHEREVVTSIPLVPATTQRFDFAPYFSSAFVINLQLKDAGAIVGAITGERWSAVWHVREGGEYQLKLQVGVGSGVVKMDGTTVLTLETLQNEPGAAAEVVLQVSAGDHRLEIQQRHGGGAQTGVRFDILAPDVPDYAPEFSPY